MCKTATVIVDINRLTPTVAGWVQP